MWMFIPSLFVPGSVGWNLELVPRSVADLALWALVNGKPEPRPLLWRGWQKRPWIRLLFGAILRPLTAELGADAWISSLRASRVNRQATPGSDPAPTMIVGSGLPCGASSSSAVPIGSSSRTSPGFSPSTVVPPSGRSSDRWPHSGGMRNGACIQRPDPEPLTFADGFTCSGILPTPTATDCKASGVSGNHTFESGRHSGTTLTDAVVRTGPDGRRLSDGKNLNPRFVEWMMGFPAGWAKLT